jgi:hypothetical protein
MASPHTTSQPAFLVFPALSSEYTWRVIASVTGRTISRHKNLALAYRKAERLNQRSSSAQLAMPDPVYADRIPLNARSILGSCKVWYDYSGGHANECNQPGAVSDVETGHTLCVQCWQANL